MEWFALVLWVTLTAVALPLGRLGAFVAPSLSLQAGLAIAGLVLSILFIIGSGAMWLLWCAFGCAVAGGAAALKAGTWLVRDDRPVSALGQDIEEHTALMIGFQLQLFVVAAFVALLAAAGMTASA